MKLIVIIRDVMPMVHFQDPPDYRRVELELTPEQVEQLTLRWVGYDNGHRYEEVSQCFLESTAELPREPERKMFWEK